MQGCPKFRFWSTGSKQTLHTTPTTMGKKQHRSSSAAVAPTKYHCLSGIPNACPAAKTVLFVPVAHAERIYQTLQSAQKSIYKSWTLDKTVELQDVGSLPSACGHIVSPDSVSTELPTEEHKILQVLIEGKVSPTQYLVVDVSEHKDHFHRWVAFQSDDDKALRQLNAILQNWGDSDGDLFFVERFYITGNPADPQLQDCNIRALTDDHISEAESSGADLREIDSFLANLI